MPVPDAGREPWLLIPPWLAGTWRAREQTILQAYSYSERRQTVTEPLKIAIDRVSRIGVQRDKDGGIWHYTGIPYIRSIETPSYVVTQHMDYIRLLSSSAETYVVQSSGIVTRVDKKSNEVFDVFREVTNTHYFQVSDGIIQVLFDVRDYDVAGAPKYSSWSGCYEWRIEPFRTINRDERGNLSQAFKDFLGRRRGLNSAQ